MILLHGRHGFPQSTTFLHSDLVWVALPDADVDQTPIRSDDDAIVFVRSQMADAV